ncbi:helix-turn-helix transcriptional regulator [Carboxylicivirga sp. N1Y90]|uniref:helix-turn-helix transcriptional regulator n=1 Tax=Carboxylicivirga fragile TaxID=3417571 RepID=UPI003D335AD5|nr:WYL domain-containing protein [Marinilabiliaceae bacterium N1Y90]
MPTNKNATIRYLTLDRCFSNLGRNYYINDLIEACNEALLDIDPLSTGVKRRQVYDDIKFMRDSKGYDAPIETFKNGKRAYYRYTDSDFSISKQPITEDEVQKLKETLLTLSRFQGLPQFEWIDDMKARLDHSFNRRSDQKVISFEENPFLTGREFLGSVYNSIINKVVIEIEYQSFRHDTTTHFTIHPYHLKQYNNRWFLFGLNDNRNEITNIPLDRICSIEESTRHYQPNSIINFEDYFEDVIGVSIPSGEKTQKVVLKLSNQLWPYVKTKPIHGSQKIKTQTEKFTIIELDLYLNYELEALILSRGEQIEVIEPIDLRNKIQERIAQMGECYL